MNASESAKWSREKVEAEYQKLSPNQKKQLKEEIRGQENITIPQALVLLDFLVSFDAVQRWVKPTKDRPYLPSSQPGGGTIFIKLEDFDNFMARSYTGKDDDQ